MHSQAGPLFLAAEHNRPRVVRLLLQHKADCTRKRVTNGWYPLHAAARHGFKEVVDILLGRLQALGAPLQVTARGQTAAELAAAHGFAQLAETIELAQGHLHRETAAELAQKVVLAQTGLHYDTAPDTPPPQPAEYVSSHPRYPCLCAAVDWVEGAITGGEGGGVLSN